MPRPLNCTCKFLQVETRGTIGAAVGGEELDDGFEIEHLVLPVYGGALGAEVVTKQFGLSRN